MIFVSFIILSSLAILYIYVRNIYFRHNSVLGYILLMTNFKMQHIGYLFYIQIKKNELDQIVTITF